MLVALKDNEKLVKIVRRYGLTYFWWFWLIFILIVAPFFFMFLLFSWGTKGIILFAASLIVGLLLLIRWLYFWYHNALVVTSERVIDIHQAGYFNRLVTELTYDKIHNVSYQIKGFAPTIFRYGKIKIQTVAGNTDLEFARIKKPAKIQEIISAARLSFMDRRNKESSLERINQMSKEDLEALKNIIENRLKTIGNTELTGPPIAN